MAECAEEAALDNPQAGTAASKSHHQQQAGISGASKGACTAATTSAAPAAPAQEEAPEAVPEPPKPSKYRHQWLQTQKMVEVSIFAKKVTAERLSMEIGAENLRVRIRDTEVREVTA